VCQSIGLFKVTRQTRHTFVELGVIPMLVELFLNGDNATKVVADSTLDVVSAHFLIH
jgi:hypothetical protein